MGSAAKKMEKTHAWSGVKGERIIIRVTERERTEIEKAARDQGGVGISRYLINLHHAKAGRLR